MNAPEGLYRHYSLYCPLAHAIPLPRPNRVGIDGSLQEITTDNRRAVFACPYCGHVSAYYGQDIHETLARTPDPFLSGDCRLVSVKAECDGRNCEARKTLHTIQDVASGIWITKVAPKDWKFSDSALCEAGHKLHLGESEHLPFVERVEGPF